MFWWRFFRPGRPLLTASVILGRLRLKVRSIHGQQRVRGGSLILPWVLGERILAQAQAGAWWLLRSFPQQRHGAFVMRVSLWIEAHLGIPGFPLSPALPSKGSLNLGGKLILLSLAFIFPCKSSPFYFVRLKDVLRRAPGPLPWRKALCVVMRLTGLPASEHPRCLLGRQHK